MSKVAYGVIGGSLSAFFVVSSYVWGIVEGITFPWWFQIIVRLSGPIGFMFLGYLSHIDQDSSYEQNLVLGIITLTAYFITIAYNSLIWGGAGKTLGDASGEEFVSLVYIASLGGSVVGSFCLGRAIKIKLQLLEITEAEME